MSNLGRAVLAAGAGLVLLGTAPTSKGETNKQSQSAENIGRALERMATAQERAVEQAKPGEYQAPCGDREYNNRSDLCAQWYAARAAGDAAIWSRYTFWLGVASAILSGIGLAALIVTIKQGREANGIARNTARHELRAYLGLREVKSALDGEGHITARLIIRNYGSTPAQKISARIRGWVGEFPSHILDGNHAEPEDFICPYTLHPGGEFELYASDDLGNPLDMLNGKTGFYVCGGITYEDFEGQPWHTNFCYRGTENTLMSKGEMRVSFEGNDAT